MPTASVNGTEIWYETQGSGHPLMLFPGLGMDHRYYRLGEPLLRDSCMTVLVDPRGVGRSRKDDPSEVLYTSELWADDFAALVRAGGLGKRRRARLLARRVDGPGDGGAPS